MNFEFDEEKHEYRLDGNVLPSVTHICRFLQQDGFQNVDPSVLAAAADRGTRIHEACMWHDYDQRDCEAELDDEEVIPYVKAYADFKRDYQIRGWDKIEYRLHTLRYAGTLDRYGKIDGKWYVVDIKTGSKVNYLAAQAQMAAYAKMLYNDVPKPYIDEDGFRVVPVRKKIELAVLHLKKDGTYTWKELNYDDGIEAFRHCLSLNDYLGGK